MALRPIFRIWRATGPCLVLGVMLFGSALGGCATSRPDTTVDEQMQVLGTWEYWTDGISLLQHGTLQIETRDGTLVARFRDQWSGSFDARVRLRGTRMEIVFDRLRITGHLANDAFRGTARTPEWDVTRQSARRETPGTFRAQRIRPPLAADERSRYGCPSLLRETSYACSPLKDW
jgi:hypothetical protein